MSEHERANRLYWESDASVNDIADELELSKSMLYQLVEPLAAEVDCPECGGMLVYPNRTALDRGLMQCSDCGAEGITSDDVDEEPVDTRPRSVAPAAGRGVDADPMWRPRDPVADRQGLLGVGLLGTAALFWLLRKS